VSSGVALFGTSSSLLQSGCGTKVVWRSLPTPPSKIEGKQDDGHSDDDDDDVDDEDDNDDVFSFISTTSSADDVDDEDDNDMTLATSTTTTSGSFEALVTNALDGDRRWAAPHIARWIPSN
jgi:hypothetical protein